MKAKPKLINSKRVFFVILTLLLLVSVYILLDVQGFIEGLKQGLKF